MTRKVFGRPEMTRKVFELILPATALFRRLAIFGQPLTTRNLNLKERTDSEGLPD